MNWKFWTLFSPTVESLEAKINTLQEKLNSEKDAIKKKALQDKIKAKQAQLAELKMKQKKV